MTEKKPTLEYGKPRGWTPASRLLLILFCLLVMMIAACLLVIVFPPTRLFTRY